MSDNTNFQVGDIVEKVAGASGRRVVKYIVERITPTGKQMVIRELDQHGAPKTGDFQTIRVHRHTMSGFYYSGGFHSMIRNQITHPEG